MSKQLNSGQKSQEDNPVMYQRRVGQIKEDIIRLGEKNMDNTLWVIRRWLRDEMGLINKPKTD